MSDVFISYARSTAKQAQAVAAALKGLGTARFFQVRSAEAVASLRAAAQLMPNGPFAQALLTAVYAQSGEMELAAQSLARFRSAMPSAELADQAIRAQIARNFHIPRNRQLLLDGLARAAALGLD